MIAVAFLCRLKYFGWGQLAVMSVLLMEIFDKLGGGPEKLTKFTSSKLYQTLSSLTSLPDTPQHQVTTYKPSICISWPWCNSFWYLRYLQIFQFHRRMFKRLVLHNRLAFERVWCTYRQLFAIVRLIKRRNISRNLIKNVNLIEGAAQEALNSSLNVFVLQPQE